MNGISRAIIRVFPIILAMTILALAIQPISFSQDAKDQPPEPPPVIPALPDPLANPPVPEVPPIKKLGDNRVQLGNIVVDTKKKEATVPGRMLQDQTLEFLATTKNGMKSYESAMELDTNATTFNLAMIMIGLERNNAVAPEGHFDPSKTVGDPVEIWVEWNDGSRSRRVRGEELLYSLDAKRTPEKGEWVYTGSGFLPDGYYLAELDGVLIGFVHDPASIIEHAGGIGLNEYGNIRLNPNLNIKPDTPLKLTVKALPE